MHYYITYEDRRTIEMMIAEEKTIKEIAEAVGKHIATVYREIERCAGAYSAAEAQKAFDEKIKKRGGHEKRKKAGQAAQVPY